MAYGFRRGGWLGGVSFPPVELIRLGNAYLVRDEHHRISVARTLGINGIEAVMPLASNCAPIPIAYTIADQVSEHSSPTIW